MSPYRICIVGGGMVGISFALVLRRAVPAEKLAITLIEAFPLEPARPGAPPPSPGFDARSTALSWGAREIYRQAGLWEPLADRACPIETIHVSEAGRFGATRMRAREEQVPALGYVVENAWLGRSLLAALHAAAGIELVAPASVGHIERGAERSRVHYQAGDGGADACDANLVVVCDGGRSDLCRRIGIGARDWDYGQHAVVFNVAGRRPHENIAYERFTGDGPLALLPLPDQRRAVICTRASAHVDTTLALDDAAMAALLRAEIGDRLGPIERIGARTAYPLRLVVAEEQVRPGLVVLGNAAHTLHPVAGQGYNLAVRDAAGLARMIAGEVAAGRDPGALAVLQEYAETRAGDQHGIIGFTHALTRLFGARTGAIGPLRGGALVTLDLFGPARHLLARHAMGVA